jgi:hypothetical protein
LIEKVNQLVAQNKRVQEAKRAWRRALSEEMDAREEYLRERHALWTLEKELAELCK